MSDYTQITDFSAKDNLSSGDAEKIVLGADFDAEFAAIVTAIASKVDTTDAATDSAAGIVELATSAEVTTGTDTARAVTPASLAGAPGSNNIGYLSIPQNAQSGNYTLVLGDAGKHIFHGSADGSGDTYTIPANSSVAFALGTTITFVNLASETVTIAITTDTMTLAGTTSTGSRTLAQNGIATAVKVTSTSWLISGVGLS